MAAMATVVTATAVMAVTAKSKTKTAGMEAIPAVSLPLGCLGMGLAKAEKMWYS